MIARGDGVEGNSRQGGFRWRESFVDIDGPCHYREGGVSSFAGHSTARFRVMGRSNGWVNQLSVDGFGEMPAMRCQQFVAILGGEPVAQ